MTLKFGSFTNVKQDRAGYRLCNKISEQSRAGQGRVREKIDRAGQDQVAKISAGQFTG